MQLQVIEREGKSYWLLAIKEKERNTIKYYDVWQLIQERKEVSPMDVLVLSVKVNKDFTLEKWNYIDLKLSMYVDEVLA